MVSTLCKPKLAISLLTSLTMNTLEERLRLALKQAQVLVINEGASGAKSGQILLGSDGTHKQSWKEITSQSKSKIIIVNYGMNDAWFDPAVTPEQYRKNLLEIISDAKSSGHVIVLETPKPMSASNKPFGSKEKANRLDRLVLEMKLESKDTGVPLIDQYTYIKSIQGWEKLIPDGVHPSRELYKIKGEFSAQSIKKILTKIT